MVPSISKACVCLRLLVLFTTLLPTVALFEDEAGLADFVISSSGGANYVGRSSPMAVVPTVLTATSSSFGGEHCFVSSRRLDTGNIVWRKVLSSSPGGEDCPSVSASDKTVVSLGKHNQTSLLSGWDVRSGDLQWQVSAGTESTDLCRVEMVTASVVAVYSCNDDLVQFYNSKKGNLVTFFSATSLTSSGDKIRRVIASDKDDSTLLVMVTTTTNAALSVVNLKVQYSQDQFQIVASPGASPESSSFALPDGAGVYYAPTQVASAHWEASSKELQLKSVFLNGGGEPAVTNIPSSDLVAALQAASEGLEGVEHSLKDDDNSEDAQEPFDLVNAITATSEISLEFLSPQWLWVSFGSTVGALLWDVESSKMAVPPPRNAAFVHSAVAICQSNVMVATTSPRFPVVKSPLRYASHSQVALSGKTWRIAHVEIQDMHVVDCSAGGKMTVYATANDGAVSLLLEGDSKGVRLVWKKEESLAAVSHAILVEDEHDDALAGSSTQSFNLDWKHRLQMQYDGLVQSLEGLQESLQSLQGLQNLWTSATSPTTAHKDHVFGFAKVAIFLSRSLNRLVGVETLKSSSGDRVRWSLPLPPQAAWHKMVRGDVTSRLGVAGGLIRQHPYSSHVLILSFVPDLQQLHWICVDGIHGTPLDSGSMVVQPDTMVVQVIPLQATVASTSWSCGSQAAAVLLDNNSLVTLPANDDGVRHALSEAAGVGPDQNANATHGGFFLHWLDEAAGTLQTLRLAPPPAQQSSLYWPTQRVGQTMWNVQHERVIQPLVYPAPHEVVQSPTAILGDDSLLLKYLNPHVAVVVTVATPEWIRQAAASEDAFATRVLESAGGEGGGKGTTKPLGVTPKPGEATATATATASSNTASSSSSSSKAAIPTLFVYLVDTVSGDVLHQTSHAPIATEDVEAAAAFLETVQLQVPVVISENWIIYAFPNFKTRRTEVGVWTLHEGMIDKHGISAFKGVEQEEVFSSFTSPKPVVLTKTFCVTSPVTALSVTQTRSGISSKQVLLGTGHSGQVAAIDRRFLDPRRPMSEPKTAEKEEGLQKYNPLLPLVPLRVPSYNRYVSSPTGIVSMAAHVESHSLLLAFGGPDIFFTRMAPSKGFDLLPDSFNRPLLTVVVLGLLIVLWTLRRMSQRKMVKVGWM